MIMSSEGLIRKADPPSATTRKPRKPRNSVKELTFVQVSTIIIEKYI
jgi:hypothetical protein